MRAEFRENRIAIAVATVLSTAAVTAAIPAAHAAKPAGNYLAGDFHNHSTCSDGSISVQKKVKKSMDTTDTPWGLDWFIQAGHGGNGNRNCMLVEDATLSTPAYPFVSGKGPTTTWANSIGAAAVKGVTASTAATSTTLLSSTASPSMWRWQSIQEFQYPLLEYLAALRNQPIFSGLESVVAGHEHSSMAVVTGQLPSSLDSAVLPSAPPYAAAGSAAAVAQWSYCFDRGDTDNSRGGGQGWDCSVPGSANSANSDWNATAMKLVPLTGGSLTATVGDRGHLKTVEAVKWMKAFHPGASYYVPAHLERAGPFNPAGNNGYNVEHLRNFNNAGPDIAFGFETQPGHGASNARGEYYPKRNGGFVGVTGNLDSVGGTTYGGTGIYGAQVGGVWDALLGEGRGFWFFASSDWHNRGSFPADDRRSTQDFYPGEYQRNYTMIRKGTSAKVRPQHIVDGLRTGNTFASSGQIIDRLGFVACASYPGAARRANSTVEALALSAARNNTDTDVAGCAAMGEKLKVRPGAEIVVAIVVRDPSGANFSPYSFANPSLMQMGIEQPLDRPVLDHVDVIRGLVTGYKAPGSADYAGEWPRGWLDGYQNGGTPSLASVPAAAKNTSAAQIQFFNKNNWATDPQDRDYKVMSFRIPAVQQSQYVRLRGTNLPRGTTWETDADGNPLPDLYTNQTAYAGSAAGANLKIVCTAAGTNVPASGTVYTSTGIDGCPGHLPVINGQKYVAYDVAAWADLWFYSNPIFVEVAGSTVVAGVK
ncbi:MAG: hypothetical protein WCJ69_10030 [Betaproteobacteria bacterium]